MKSPRLSLAVLMGAQAQVTFNDCAAKFMLIALAQQLARTEGYDAKPVITLIGWLLVLPYVAFGPICGWLSDRYAKRTVINGALVLQIGVMILMVGALWGQSFTAALTGFVLLSLQTCIMGPAKRGILLEYAGEKRLSRFVGYMEMLNITAILVGTFAGGQLFSHWLQAGDDIWTAGLKVTFLLTGLSVLAWAGFQLAAPSRAQSTEPFHARLWVRHFTDVAEVWRERPLWRATMGICFFYGIGGYFMQLVPQIAYEMEAGGVRTGAVASTMMLMVGVGTMVGHLLAGLLSRRGVELGLAPLGGALLLAMLFAMGFVPFDSRAFTGLLIGAGFSTGLFVVPLYAFIQQKAGDHRRGRILAGVALLDSLAGLVAGGIYLLLAGDVTLALAPQTQFFLMALLTLGMLLYGVWHIPHHTVCTVMRLIGPLFYRVKSIGWENIPSGGALMICNHLSYVDAVVLQIASPRPIRFIAFAGFVKSPFMRFVFRAAGVIPVTANKPMKGIRLAVEAIQQGELVCVFPEGAISRTGQLMILKRGFGLIAESARAPVVPAAIDGLWGSIYSFAGNKYLWKSPRLKPTPVCVMFGPPIPPEKVDMGTARRALLDLGEQAFQERPVLRRHLAREAIRALAKHPRHIAIVDRTADRKEVSAGQLVAVAAVLARRLRATAPGQRIGIVLPPGAGAAIANLAVACAGKVPVNLNFTAGKAAVEASLRLGEITTVITADAMRAKVPNFPFPEHTVDLKQEIAAAGGKKAILPWLLAVNLLPNQWVAGLLGLPRTGDHAEAALLFTSGSSGEPKGVVLTHRNILSNCAQISSLSILPETATMLGCLPIFHSFGFTVTLWYPILRGCRVVTVPSPLDTKKIVDAIQQEKATVMVGAPTFIRPFLKKATKAELQSLNLVVTGAEKLPMDLYDAFLAQFGIEILQGYGLTETTPAASINQYHPPITTSTAEHQEGKRLGAVGRLLPGSTARITDPDTGEDLPLNSTGMLWLKGPHVFPGYLKDPEKTAAAIKDRWFITGDLGRIDDDGFLFIEGRLSRFSKIGGEMVPHGTIEQRLVTAFDWDQSEGPTAVVTGIPDATKGEALVLLTTRDVLMADIRTKLLEAGFPNLWVPKLIVRVDAIPVLGTGKTDLKGCRTVAIERAAAQAES
ncbi:Bifunctional protein Aas [Lacunisphaera limnophila]|uniref:Bifunctional protein Aas n=1 Tax=Lacunisphaera limnophila TaxID=1838286 RepID=A0A1D8AZB4_9BACT|nr:MFS transporter [Lacunisphaera limnophila]AOS46217.1 Bifunctional protein Aas [Lacunisphaera limnophila]